MHPMHLLLTAVVALAQGPAAENPAPGLATALTAAGEGWWAGKQDPADSLYRAGRRALNRGRYQEAVDLFREILRRHPRSAHASDALYWTAFALYRTGDASTLRQAQELLVQLRERHPDASLRGDAETLAARIDGELARRGDADAAARVAQQAESAAGPRGEGPRGRVPPRPPAPPRPPRPPQPGVPSFVAEDEDDIRVAALNALLQMDAERAIPILRKVLARRDTGSVRLRRKAVFLVSQKRTPETASILLDAVRNDPDQEVREQAVFWLSQVPSEEAVTALDSLLRSSTDPAVQEKAIFALSQHRSERAGAALRAYVERRDASLDLRERAIFWLGQHHSAENAAFLRNLFPRLETEELKEKVLFAISQRRGEENTRWLMDIALNERENIEIRKKALFWTGQARAPIADLVALYDRMADHEMKEQLLFVYAQRREAAAVDKLFDIAKNERDRELRKKAIFWLGQSRDPRVPQFLQDLLGNP